MSVGFKSIKRMVGSGDSLSNILLLWLPETVTQFIFIILPPLLDSYIVASLKSTATFGALGAANNFLHALLKFGEAIPIASIAIIGRHNGAKEYDKCGKDLGDTFWVTTMIGIIQFILIFSHTFLCLSNRSFCARDLTSECGDAAPSSNTTER